MYYMGIIGRGVTTYLYLRTKRSNKKQKSRFSIDEINNQYFRKSLNNFKNSLSIGLKTKQVHNEPTEAYLLLNKQVTKIMKIERHI